MSIHPSLRKTAMDKQQRSVLKRIERIQKLIDEEEWEEDKVFKLPKIKTVKMKVKKDKPKDDEAEGETKAEGAPEAAAEKGKEPEKAKPQEKKKK